MSNHNGKGVEEVTCPWCDTVGPHSNQETDQSLWQWNDDASEILRKITSKDFTYQTRTKKCVNCDQSFQTVEVSRHYLNIMIEELKRLHKVEALKEQDEKEIYRLREQLKICGIKLYD